jgi:hypothetical protein
VDAHPDAHALLPLCSAATSPTASSTAGASSSRHSLSVDGGEFLATVQRVVEGNEQAYESLTPHLYSCAGLAGVFVDRVNELEDCRRQATRCVCICA